MFSMADILGNKALVVEYNCPTNKTPYPNKKQAEVALRHLKRTHGDHRARTTTFRCGYCAQYHIGRNR